MGCCAFNNKNICSLFHLYTGLIINILILYVFEAVLFICFVFMCNELGVIWPVPHEILSVITRSTIIT